MRDIQGNSDLRDAKLAEAYSAVHHRPDNTSVIAVEIGDAGAARIEGAPDDAVWNRTDMERPWKVRAQEPAECLIFVKTRCLPV